MSRTRAATITKTIRQRFMDQIDADEEAERFLIASMHMRDQTVPRPGQMRLKWWNLEGDDGRCGTLSDGCEVIASVTVTRDDMNWSSVCGVAFEGVSGE